MSCKIYMDHAATTDMLPQVRKAMDPYLMDEYGNASTAYGMGQRAQKAMEDAREKIAYRLDAHPEEIFFTSGGSESDNWVVKNVAGAKKEQGKHIITSQIEHHAILRSCEYLESLGYYVTYLPVDDYGVVDPKELKDAIKADTTLVSIMTGNNEIGTIEPITELGLIAKSKGVDFHTDAVQAVGQIPLSLAQLPVDYLSASAHKFHGPKGVGFLYVRKDENLPSFIHGGSQERGKRAGTENVAGIVGMAEALDIAVQEMRYTRPRLIRLRNYFVERVLHEIAGTRLNGHRYQRLPGNVNFSIRGVDATALLVLMEEEGICASAGSACNTGQTRISHVIEAIHVPEDYAAGSIRFTMGRATSRQEVDQTIEALKKCVEILRKA
uniref:cysteine desulfurase family protein n=1 Tax=Agathobacter sp. TaxID=2021311 RepID=UPI004028E8F5